MYNCNDTRYAGRWLSDFSRAFRCILLSLICLFSLQAAFAQTNSAGLRYDPNATLKTIKDGKKMSGFYVKVDAAEKIVYFYTDTKLTRQVGEFNLGEQYWVEWDSSRLDPLKIDIKAFYKKIDTSKTSFLRTQDGTRITSAKSSVKPSTSSSPTARASSSSKTESKSTASSKTTTTASASTNKGNTSSASDYQFHSEITVLPKGTDGSAGTGGTYVYFGDWPQTIKDPDVKIDEKKTIVMGGNTYYHGDDGFWYAKVTENGHVTGREAPYFYNYYSDNSTVSPKSANRTRYFKVEPIKWRVITKDYNGTKKALLFAESILVAMPYYQYEQNADYELFNDLEEKTPVRSVGADKKIYENNYQYSQVRAFLNGLDYYTAGAKSSTKINSSYKGKGFLQTAFTASAQNLICITNLDNSVDPKYIFIEDSKGRTKNYSSGTTQDKVFLLSIDEMENTEYFINRKFDFNDFNVTYPSRVRVSSDYALANGSNSSEYKGGYYYLRTPFFDDYGREESPEIFLMWNSRGAVYSTNLYGRIFNANTSYVDVGEMNGVVPAITVDLELDRDVKVDFSKLTMKMLEDKWNASEGSIPKSNVASKADSKGMVLIKGGTVKQAVRYSSVFTYGRNLTIPDFYMSETRVQSEDILKYGNAEGIVTWYDAIIYCNDRSIAEGYAPVYYIENNKQKLYEPADWADIPDLCVVQNKQGYYIVDYPGIKWGGPLTAFDDAIKMDMSADGYRLPTEAEWEYALRGGNGGIPESQSLYWNSIEIEGKMFSYNDTTAEDAKKRTPTLNGIYGMIDYDCGEFCWDRYVPGEKLGDNVPIQGPSEGEYHVCRGIYDRSSSLTNDRRVSNRNLDMNTIYGLYSAQFRVVRTKPEEQKSYSISIQNSSAGTVSSSSKTAKKGMIVRLTANPSSGNELASYTVKDASGKAVFVSKSNSFVMPDSQVTVSATFKTAQGNAVKINAPKYGKIVADKTTAVAGDKVTLSVILPTGCEVSSLSVVDSAGKTVLVSEDGSFIMPKGGATVSAKTAKPDMSSMVLVNGGHIEKKRVWAKYDGLSSLVFNGNKEFDIKDYYISDHMLTQGEWDRFMTYYSRDNAFGTGPDYPVSSVSAAEVIIYCNLLSIAEGLEPYYYVDLYETDPAQWAKNERYKITTDSKGKYYCNDYYSFGAYVSENQNANGYRLLTEEEWEYAALEGNGGFRAERYKTSWDRMDSEESAKYIWADGKGHAVKQKLPNALGIYDMLEFQTYVEGALRGGNTYPPQNNYTIRGRYTSNIDNEARGAFGFRLGRNYLKPGYVSYAVEPKQGAGGTLSVNKEYAKKGERVTVNVTPKSGYNIDTLVVSTSKGTRISVPRNGGEFIMPDEAVIVEATFTKPRADGMVKVTGCTVSEPIKGSKLFEEEIFRKGQKYVIPDMWVSDHEVTQAEYEKYMEYHMNNWGERFEPGDTPLTEASDDPEYPAYYVTWFDAILYCNLRSIAEGLTPVYYISDNALVMFFNNDIKRASDPKEWMKLKDDPVNVWETEIEKTSDGKYIFTKCSASIAQNEEADGYRLPTEMEWEYIAQGGNGGFPEKLYTYAGSDTFEDVAWYDDKIHKGKGKQPNALGIYDLTGNALEWVFGEGRGAARGGSFKTFDIAKLQNIEPYMDVFENTTRSGRTPDTKDFELGFRVVRTRFE